ncbi:hypothetical protein [Arenimonas sp.]|uniref:phage tail tube protein n=1 Tax=Arenimonas sp. TaxID=1872635 RepID=UPI0025C66A77|nr:hypothetical protein [Arenimonas sp.]
MAGFSGQGKVWIGGRTVGGNAEGLKWVGNAPAFSVALTEDVSERNESFSGARLPFRRATRAKQATIQVSFDEWNKENLARLLQATVTTVAAGAAVVGEVAPSGLVVGDKVILAGQNVSAVSVVDSTGSPKTLPPASYELNAAAGSWELKDLTTGAPYVQPFKTTYTPGQRQVIAPFNSGNPEQWIRFEGVNTDDNTPVIVDLYRVRMSPTRELPLINDDFATFEVEGSVLVDSTKPSGGTLGQFGRIILP